MIRTFDTSLLPNPSSGRLDLESSYANIVSSSTLERLFAVYNLNVHNVSAPGGKRKDELGLFFLRYSDDGGRSWSADRYAVPYPNTWIDDHNSFVSDPVRNGTRMMWTVDQVNVRGTTVMWRPGKPRKWITDSGTELTLSMAANGLGWVRIEPITDKRIIGRLLSGSESYPPCSPLPPRQKVS